MRANEDTPSVQSKGLQQSDHFCCTGPTFSYRPLFVFLFQTCPLPMCELVCAARSLSTRALAARGTVSTPRGR